MNLSLTTVSLAGQRFKALSRLFFNSFVFREQGLGVQRQRVSRRHAGTDIICAGDNRYILDRLVEHNCLLSLPFGLFASIRHSLRSNDCVSVAVADRVGGFVGTSTHVLFVGRHHKVYLRELLRGAHNGRLVESTLVDARAALHRKHLALRPAIQELRLDFVCVDTVALVR